MCFYFREIFCWYAHSRTNEKSAIVKEFRSKCIKPFCHFPNEKVLVSFVVANPINCNLNWITLYKIWTSSFRSTTIDDREAKITSTIQTITQKFKWKNSNRVKCVMSIKLISSNEKTKYFQSYSITLNLVIVTNMQMKTKKLSRDGTNLRYMVFYLMYKIK